MTHNFLRSNSCHIAKHKSTEMPEPAIRIFSSCPNSSKSYPEILCLQYIRRLTCHGMACQPYPTIVKWMATRNQRSAKSCSWSLDCRPPEFLQTSRTRLRILCKGFGVRICQGMFGDHRIQVALSISRDQSWVSLPCFWVIRKKPETALWYWYFF